jgi:hypothetical protein
MKLLDSKSDDILKKIFGHGKNIGTSFFEKIKNFWKTNMRRY